MELKDHVAVVTGSATGLGAAIALKLAERGARVVINYTKSLKEAEETLGLAKAKGVDAVLAQGDVANDDDCRRIRQHVEQTYAYLRVGQERLDALAGIQAVELGHGDIHQQNVWPKFDGLLDQRPAVRYRSDDLVNRLEQFLERIEQHGVIICQQDAALLHITVLYRLSL